MFILLANVLLLIYGLEIKATKSGSNSLQLASASAAASGKKRKMGLDEDFLDDSGSPMDGVELDSSSMAASSSVNREATASNSGQVATGSNSQTAAQAAGQSGSGSGGGGGSSGGQSHGNVRSFGDLFDDDDLD